MIKLSFLKIIIFMFFCLLPSAVFAQGQDSTTAERDIMILSELLPGQYNNSNQAYFDVRLKYPVDERHEAISADIERVSQEELGEIVFKAVLKRAVSNSKQTYFFSLGVDYPTNSVRMKVYSLRPDEASSSFNYLSACDLLWQQEAGQFRGKSASTTPVSGCSLSALNSTQPLEMMLTNEAFWIQFPEEGSSYFELDRARNFDCYVDFPGVGGGRDIPFKRYELNDVNDLGGEKWATLDDGTEIGVSLFRVMWAFNNYNNIFTRPSFVIYLKTRNLKGEVKENGYAWTVPTAQRIGINQKWALANCFMLSNDKIKPFYKNTEPKK